MICKICTAVACLRGGTRTSRLFTRMFCRVGLSMGVYLTTLAQLSTVLTANVVVPTGYYVLYYTLSIVNRDLFHA